MTYSYAKSAKEYFDLANAIQNNLPFNTIDAYAELVFEAWQDDHTVFVFGNGGSASCASHHVSDYVKTAQVEGQRRLRALSLVDNVEMMTAIGNDIDYESIFVHPLESYAKPGDVAVAISCSGNSSNVVKALEWAKEHQLHTVAITGFTGGQIGEIADLHIHIPSDNYGIVEDAQLSIGHIVAQCLFHKVSKTASAT